MIERQRLELVGIVESSYGLPRTIERFRLRVSEGRFTREENRESHFCVYCAIYDPRAKEVFIGHHIKSGVWLFNGGHGDPGETPPEVAAREFWEETGQKIAGELDGPELLTVTDINRPGFPCWTHFDMWYFVAVDRATFSPDRESLAKEFHEIGRMSVSEAREKTNDLATLEALDYLEAKLA